MQAYFGVRWLDTALDFEQDNVQPSKAVSSQRTPKDAGFLLPHSRHSVDFLSGDKHLKIVENA